MSPAVGAPTQNFMQTHTIFRSFISFATCSFNIVGSSRRIGKFIHKFLTLKKLIFATRNKLWLKLIYSARGPLRCTRTTSIILHSRPQIENLVWPAATWCGPIENPYAENNQNSLRNRIYFSSSSSSSSAFKFFRSSIAIGNLSIGNLSFAVCVRFRQNAKSVALDLLRIIMSSEEFIRWRMHIPPRSSDQNAYRQTDKHTVLASNKHKIMLNHLVLRVIWQDTPKNQRTRCELNVHYSSAEMQPAGPVL